jgi:hypothetical protein
VFTANNIAASGIKVEASSRFMGSSPSEHLQLTFHPHRGCVQTMNCNVTYYVSSLATRAALSPPHSASCSAMVALNQARAWRGYLRPATV